MHALHLPLSFKAAADGAFSGHAAIFGNVDLGGDVIERGAFKEINADAAGRVPVLWQHYQHSPIGTAEVRETTKGLQFDGMLVLEDPLARTAHAHMKAGSVRGMSIGYDVLPGGEKLQANGVRVLSAIKLWEVSAVTFAMNPGAHIEAVKQLPMDVRSFERWLHSMGFSKGRATAIASCGFAASGLDHDDLDPLQLQAAHDALLAMTKSLKVSHV